MTGEQEPYELGEEHVREIQDRLANSAGALDITTDDAVDAIFGGTDVRELDKLPEGNTRFVVWDSTGDLVASGVAFGETDATDEAVASFVDKLQDVFGTDVTVFMITDDGENTEQEQSADEVSLLREKLRSPETAREDIISYLRLLDEKRQQAGIPDQVTDEVDQDEIFALLVNNPRFAWEDGLTQYYSRSQEGRIFAVGSYITGHDAQDILALQLNLDRQEFGEEVTLSVQEPDQEPYEFSPKVSADDIDEEQSPDSNPDNNADVAEFISGMNEAAWAELAQERGIDIDNAYRVVTVDPIDGSIEPGFTSLSRDEARNQLQEPIPDEIADRLGPALKIFWVDSPQTPSE